MDSYNEAEGVYALKVDDYAQGIERINASSGLTWIIDDKAYVDTQFYYANLPGDNQADATFVFTQNRDIKLNSFGDALDRNALGLKLSAGIAVSEDIDISASYTVEKSSEFWASRLR